MNGRPVWLASVSLRDRVLKRIVQTGLWTVERVKTANVLIDRLLEGVGDPGIERAFRMNVTRCRHRRLRPDEEERLPAYWHETPPMDLAGGPVESLWARGYEPRPSIMPCHNPHRILFDVLRQDLWVPTDCGECEPCRDRIRVRAGVASEGNAP